MSWISVNDYLPESGKPVLLHFVREKGGWDVIRAQYAGKHSLPSFEYDDECDYCEESDQFFCPEGWYETNEFEQVHWKVHGKPVHWTPMPEAPRAKSGDRE